MLPAANPTQKTGNHHREQPYDDLRVEAIAAAARDLVQQRDAWLNPPGLGEHELPIP